MSSAGVSWHSGRGLGVATHGFATTNACPIRKWVSLKVRWLRETTPMGRVATPLKWVLAGFAWALPLRGYATLCHTIQSEARIYLYFYLAH